MARPIIEIDNVIKRFGDFTAVDGVSIDVKEGEIFGLLGPNGAGKTTLINLILGLLSITSGKITIDNLDIKHNKDKVKRLIGMMTQETVVESELTARENLEVFAQLYHVNKSELNGRVEDSLKDADLIDFADKKAGTFSGGMKRRLELVKSMVHKPKIIILDEPTTGLDIQNRNHLWEEIKRLSENGITTILTTQYLEEADFLCNRIAIIDHGKIKAIGTASELKMMVGTGDVVEIISKPDNVEKVAKLLKSLKLSPIVKSEKVSAPMGSDSVKMLNNITTALQKNKIAIISINMHMPTLDDVFLKLTGNQLRDTTGENVSARSQIMMRR